MYVRYEDHAVEGSTIFDPNMYECQEGFYCDEWREEDDDGVNESFYIVIQTDNSDWAGHYTIRACARLTIFQCDDPANNLDLTIISSCGDQAITLLDPPNTLNYLIK